MCGSFEEFTVLHQVCLGCLDFAKELYYFVSGGGCSVSAWDGVGDCIVVYVGCIKEAVCGRTGRKSRGN